MAKTKKAAVTKALVEFVARRRQKELLELFGRLTWDMDGGDGTFSSINDSYGSSLDGLLYDAYVEE